MPTPWVRVSEYLSAEGDVLFLYHKPNSIKEDEFLLCMDDGERDMDVRLCPGELGILAAWLIEQCRRLELPIPEAEC